MLSSLRKTVLAILLLFAVSALFAARLLIHSDAETQITLTTEALLKLPGATTIQIPADVTYRRTMTYRAVPLRALPGLRSLPADAELQIKASDGFVSSIPANLVSAQNGGAVPWLAIEPRSKSWPPIGGGKDIGPFYLVWTNPNASGVMSEQWPYQIDSIRVLRSDAKKWPQLAVDAAIPAISPIHRGLAVLTTQCMACHRVDGAGEASVGPDLNRPHNPAEYFQPWALKAYIRDPKSIRSWSAMKMPGFDKNALSDADLDALIAYLDYLAQKRPH